MTTRTTVAVAAALLLVGLSACSAAPAPAPAPAYPSACAERLSPGVYQVITPREEPAPLTEARADSYTAQWRAAGCSLRSVVKVSLQPGSGSRPAGWLRASSGNFPFPASAEFTGEQICLSATAEWLGQRAVVVTYTVIRRGENGPIVPGKGVSCSAVVF